LRKGLRAEKKGGGEAKGPGKRPGLQKGIRSAGKLTQFEGKETKLGNGCEGGVAIRGKKREYGEESHAMDANIYTSLRVQLKGGGQLGYISGGIAKKRKYGKSTGDGTV